MSSGEFVDFEVLVFVTGFDEDVDALGGVAAGGRAVVFVEETQEVGEGFDFVVLAFLIADFFGFAFGVVVLDTEEGAVLGAADFEFHRGKVKLSRKPGETWRAAVRRRRRVRLSPTGSWMLPGGWGGWAGVICRLNEGDGLALPGF
jgi:hypothetical protein